MKLISKNKLNNSALVQSTFEYWFKDRGHIRTPFPIYIRKDLEKQAVSRFMDWINQLDEKGKKEMGDGFFRDKFEEILFQTAIGLVKTEDEKLTLHFPFMLRHGDKVKENKDDARESTVIARRIFIEGDRKFMLVRFRREKDAEEWERKFELPA